MLSGQKSRSVGNRRNMNMESQQNCGEHVHPHMTGWISKDVRLEHCLQNRCNIRNGSFRFRIA